MAIAADRAAGEPHEGDSASHKIYRSVAGHGHKGSQTHADTNLPGIVPPGATGVCYVSDRASANGFKGLDDPDWANFGQGAPETGPLPGGSERPTVIDFSKLGDAVHEYAPTTGVKPLREAVANLYNETYRKGKASQYTYENVCIVPGGRSGLSRVASVIGDVFVGYFVPEYTAYSDMLSVFHRLVPLPGSLKAEDGFKLDIPKLKRHVQETGITAVALSNPRNPTGTAVVGEELADLVSISRNDTTVILDEFYSWYTYGDEEGACHSGAEYVEDVNEDATVLIDGLTKGPRLPGWRVCWVVGPKSLITALSQAGSFLDGGANHVLQVAAIPMLDPDRCRQDRIALQRTFRKKRDYVIDRLDKLGLTTKAPDHTFYIWLDLSSLPEPLNNGLAFFEELLKENTIVTPGIFFDLNPSHRRNLKHSPCAPFVRLSYGPPMDNLKRGLDGIERLLERARRPQGLAAMDKDLAQAPKADTPESTHGQQAG